MTHTEPGAPLSLTPPPTSELIAATEDFANGDGFQLILTDGTLVITCRMAGNEGELGIGIEQLLEAVGKYNRRTGS